MTDSRIHLVSLGAWCRPAHNLRLYAQEHGGFAARAAPFDWTITSFRALQHCLAERFDPASVLAHDNIVASFARSGMCGESGLVFHHALHAAALEGAGVLSPGQRVRVTPGTLRLIKDAKGRFMHTFGTLGSLRIHQECSVFVRWQKFGHPDSSFPEVFEDETNEGLVSLIREFLGHDRFRLLVIRSLLVPDRRERFGDPIAGIKAESEQCIACTIRERKGWNGDQTYNFKGDEDSWRAAFDAAFSLWRLSPPATGDRPSGG